MSIVSVLKRSRFSFYFILAYAISITSALLLLIYYFLIHDFRVLYVYEYSDRTVPTIYLISAVWAGREGSLLLWVTFLAIMNVILYKTGERLATAISSFVFLFLTVTLLTVSNPFVRLGFTPYHGYGLNPLLRTIEMIFHPPVIFLAYSSMTIPFSITLARTYRGEDWKRAARRWLILTWLFLTLGIFIGMLWSYRVLGWGGFWAWDPVENASLLPWLTVTALLHGIILEERRGAFKNLNYWLSVLSFDLVILATFITRSGIIQSIHAFARNPVGWAYFILIVISTILAFVLWRRKESGKIHGFLDNLLALNVYVLLLITFTVLLGTLAGMAFSVSKRYYDLTVLPLMGFLAVLSGVCVTSGKRNLVYAIVGVFFGFLTYYTLKMPLLSVAVAICAYSISAHIANFGVSGRRVCGYLAHIGFMLLLIGAVGAWMYSVTYKADLNIGQAVKVGKMYMKLLDVGMLNERSKYVIIAELLLKYGGGTYITYPKIYIYKIFRPDRMVSAVYIIPGIIRDIYVAMPSFMNGFYFVVHVIPMVSFVWISMILMAFGGIYALVKR